MIAKLRDTAITACFELLRRMGKMGNVRPFKNANLRNYSHIGFNRKNAIVFRVLMMLINGTIIKKHCLIGR